MTTGVALSVSKVELVPLVADLHAHGYTAADIARVVKRSDERIRQVLRDLGVRKPHARSVDDLPPYLKDRVLAFLNLKNTSES